MKKMKKILAMFLAMAMVLGMSMTTFAAYDANGQDENDWTKIQAPAENQYGWVSIKGITPEQATFKAYQIIKPAFNEKNKGFIGYEWVEGYGTGAIKINDGVITDLNSDNINAWALNPKTTATTFTEDTAKALDGNAGTALKLGVGTWMIIATPKTNQDIVYNPMVASVYYKEQSNVSGGTVEGAGKWELETSDAYVKSTDLTNKSDKKVVTWDEEKSEYVDGDANQLVGTSITYQLSGLIPSYGPEYFNIPVNPEQPNGDKKEVVYKLRDKIVNGLSYVVENNKLAELKVLVGGNPVSENTDYTFTWNDDNKTGFVIQFTQKFLQGKAGADAAQREVKVIYSAIITKDAVSQNAENTLAIDFTREPGVDYNVPEGEEEKAYAYTATINNVIKKTKEGGDVLGGAEFTIYTDESAETQVTWPEDSQMSATATSDSTTGNIKFEGLKFGIDYYLKETKAPTGYSINNTIYKVKCEYPDGVDEEDLLKGAVKLDKYLVTITNMSSGEVELDKVEVKYGGEANMIPNAVAVVNTTLSELPSTGGIGTTIFTVGGCAIMIIAAGLYFASRRKAAK